MSGTAVALTATKTTLTQHHAGSRPATLIIAGQLKPAPAAAGEHMVVTASFGTTLYNSPTTGVCKIVAKYRGDDTYAASKAVARVQCRTGQSA